MAARQSAESRGAGGRSERGDVPGRHVRRATAKIRAALRRRRREPNSVHAPTAGDTGPTRRS